MIQRLIGLLIELLEEGFTGLVDASRIQVGPIALPDAANSPAVALYTGELTFDQDFTDVSSSEPRPVEIKRTLAVINATPQGPYDLGQVPMPGTMLLKVVYDPGEAGERRQLLQETVDYTIDYTNEQLNFIFDMTDAGELELEYNTPAIFTFRAFEQEFWIDIYDDDVVNLERLAALASAMILTRYNSLLEDFNDDAANSYSATDYVSQHRLSALHLLAGVPDHSNTTRLIRLQFQVRGSLRLSRILDEPVGFIDKVFSPGKEGSAYPVDINPELG